MQNEKPNQNDFEKMQQQAIRRAKEMQQKSTVTGRQGAAPPPKREEAPRPDERKRPDEKHESKNEKDEEKNPLASLLNLDGDMSMLLPLVLLLSKEGTDEIMILALLYIMS